MAKSQFSLSWNEHSKNISNGLSFLQQNGEFVDMTLAADGHLVKVHQVIIALSSPYLKDLIASAQCPHPVIVLNKISHSTLTAILEYIYTGEVLVEVDKLNELIDAAKELHIKGLQEMNLSESDVNRCKSNEIQSTQSASMESDDEISYFEIAQDSEEPTKGNENSVVLSEMRCMDDGTLYEIPVTMNKSIVTPGVVADVRSATVLPSDTRHKVGALQYTVSNQGSLQLILNRFVYYLKHTNQDRSRQWRCVDYLNSCKCPAHVITKDDVVLQRISAHRHPFHDKKILKKLTSGTIYSTIIDAVSEGKNLKNRYKEMENE